MRLVTAVLLAAPLSGMVVCAQRSQKPDPDSIATLELHAWNQRRKNFQYWVTKIDVETACVASDSVTDGMLHLVRDCSLAKQLRPRVDELVAVFEQAEEPRAVGERVADDGDGQAAVFVRHDGTRWTADSKLLGKGAELLGTDTSEWLLLGAAPTQLSPSAAGWTELELRDREGVLERHLSSDGRWSCESWLVYEQTLEHVILTRRGRIEAERAATLLDSFADGLAPVLAGEGAQEWTASLTPEDPSAAIQLRGDELVARWDSFAAELSEDCTLDPLPAAPRPDAG